MNWVPNKSIDKEKVNIYLQESIDTNQFTNGGPVVSKLERTLRDLLQIDSSKSIVCVANGTVALWAAAVAIEMQAHHSHLRYATQSFTFPASAQGPLSKASILDIDSDCGPDLSFLQCYPDTIDCLIVTNVFGNVVNIAKYEEWAKLYSKYIIYDNAATPFTSFNGRNSCNYGTAATLSFHHTKPIGFGEGGAIIIDSIYEKTLRRIINFGIDNSVVKPLNWSRKGGNYKMSDIQAAYILQYILKIPNIKQHHQELYSYFADCMDSVKGIRLFPNWSDEIPFVSCLCILSDKSDSIIQDLLKENIFCRKYYNPLSLTPNAIEMYSKIVCISLTVDMDKEDINTIVSILQNHGEST
jgi:dTDP-4-amino-4,6-dideoxygalactose transaminase